MAALQERHVRCFRTSWRHLFLAAFILPMLMQTCAAADASLEYAVKAAFLLNFTKFVEWPQTTFADPHAPIEICVSGKNPFGSALEEVVRGEAVNGHGLAAREIGPGPPPATCQVLFIGPDVKDSAKLLGSVARGVLTVGEGERFIYEGGMIAFVIDNRRVRFDVNQAAAENADVKISSKLLSIARKVSRQP